MEGRRKRHRKSFQNSPLITTNQKINNQTKTPTSKNLNKNKNISSKDSSPSNLLMLTSSSSSSSSSVAAEPLDLPCSILIDILGRLPLKTLIDCRYVCKSWRSLLTESYFYKLYTQHKPTTLILQIKGNSLNALGEMCILERDTPGGVSIIRKVRLTTLSKKHPSFKIDPNFRYQLGNGCNGLICLRDTGTREPSLVWNPIMGQFVVLPKPGTNTDDKVVAGLGFCARTNRFKVVRIFHGVTDPVGKRRAEVYDLGVGNEWRDIGDVPFRIPSRIPGFFTNNSLHWILECPYYYDNDDFSNKNSSSTSNVELICGFDFVEEKFRGIAPPPIFLDQENKYHWSNLGIIADCLSICAIDAKLFRPDVQVWVMEEYGVSESWALRLSIRDPAVEWWDPYRWIQVTSVLRNGEIVMLCAHCHVLAYNVRERRFRSMDALDFPAIAHVPSLISLEDVLSDQHGTGSLNVRYV